MERIVFVCRIYPTHRPGGMPFCVQDRARKLAELGYDVHVLTTGNPGAMEIQDEGVSVHHLACRPQVYGRDFAEECSRVTEELNPSILHLDSFDGQQLWWEPFVGKLRSVAVTMHGFGFGASLTTWNRFRCEAVGYDVRCESFNGLAMRFEAKALAKFDRVLAVSRHEYWMLRDCYGLARVRLVYNPIPEYFFDMPQSLPPKDGPFIAVAISGHHERGFFMLERLGQAGAHHVMVVDSCQREKMPVKYDESLALLLPTFYAQGFDLSVAEALARRRPVIASATGSYYREAEAGLAGLLTFTTGDADELSQRMAEVRADPAAFLVPEESAKRHRPDVHASNWLNALGV